MESWYTESTVDIALLLSIQVKFRKFHTSFLLEKEKSSKNKPITGG